MQLFLVTSLIPMGKYYKIIFYILLLRTHNTRPFRVRKRGRNVGVIQPVNVPVPQANPIQQQPMIQNNPEIQGDMDEVNEEDL